MSHWEDVLREYKQRKVRTLARAMPGALVPPPGMPAIPGQNNWTPLGPSIIARGQTANRAAVSGRVCGMAIAPGG